MIWTEQLTPERSLAFEALSPTFLAGSSTDPTDSVHNPFAPANTSQLLWSKRHLDFSSSFTQANLFSQKPNFPVKTSPPFKT